MSHNRFSLTCLRLTALGVSLCAALVLGAPVAQATVGAPDVAGRHHHCGNDPAYNSSRDPQCRWMLHRWHKHDH
jgi:hypothetical protein